LGPKEKRILVACILIFLAALFTYKLRYGRAEAESLPRLDSIPLDCQDWRGQDFPLDERTAEILGADLNLNRRYANGEGQTVWLFLSYFKDQRYGSQIHSPQNCLPGSGWAIVQKEMVKLKTGGDRLESRLLEARKGEKEVRVYYWFLTRSGTLADEYALKLDLISNALRGHPTDALFVRLTTEAEPAVIEEFLRIMWPHISGQLTSQNRAGVAE